MKDHVVRRDATGEEQSSARGLYRYVRVVDLPSTDNHFYRVKAWTQCQRCAAHFTQDEAHEVAHNNGAPWTVVRIKPRATSSLKLLRAAN